MDKTFLLTGPPGSGKTTVLRKALARLACNLGGFYTQEMRVGKRVGFELVTLDGREGVMAHVDHPKIERIGRYGVDLEVIDALGVGSIRRALSGGGLVVIDEIGPMEILSERFRAIVLEVLESEARMLATIVQRRMPFTDAVKAHPSASLHVLERSRAEEMVERILGWVQS